MVETQKEFTYAYYLVSGGVAGMVEHLSMFPVDTIKTKMQAPGSTYLNFKHCFKSTVKKGGIRALYRGVPAGVCGAFPSHAAYFTVYEKAKQILIGDEDEGKHPVRAAAAGACATIGHDFFHTPFDVVKQRLQISEGKTPVLTTLRNILSKEGFRALYVSYPTTLTMNIPFSSFHFATYETVKHLLRSTDEELEQSFWKFAVAGGCGGTLGGIVSTPFDVVKTRQQLGTIPTMNVFRAFRHCYAKEGARIFTRGMQARIFYFAPSGAIQMTSYEVSKWLLAPSFSRGSI